MSQGPSAESWAARQRELRRAWLRGTGIAAVAILIGGLLAGGFVAARYEAQMGQVRREAFAFRERLQAEDSARRERASTDQRVVSLLADPATRVIALRAGTAGGTAQGRAVWNDAMGGQIWVSGLAPTPGGKVYLVWAVRAGKSSPAVSLSVDATGRGSAALPPLGGPVEAFVVTLEPTGGGATPTGPVVLSSR
jgi:hypothetical protein